VELAKEAGVSLEQGRPYVDRLVERGMVQRDDGILRITSAGSAAADRLFAAQREGLERLLSDWSPEQHADLAHMLDRLSLALMGEDAERDLIRS
jgi:DNA-binding MarR family transcriptional regulator